MKVYHAVDGAVITVMCGISVQNHLRNICSLRCGFYTANSSRTLRFLFSGQLFFPQMQVLQYNIFIFKVIALVPDHMCLCESGKHKGCVYHPYSVMFLHSKQCFDS